MTFIDLETMVTFGNMRFRSSQTVSKAISWLFLIGFLLFYNSLFAQESSDKVYLSTENSLSQRETPQWFNNAKLGIFIHWGLYSVPAWATPTTTPDKVTVWKAFYKSNPYAEWYLNSVAYTMYADCQLHEIIHRYKPDILWNDVNYPKNGDLLGIFAELFNLNSNAVINDRWGQYPEFANFTTPEYKVLDSIETKKWETCRGLGYSFGYNQVEDDQQLLSSGDLINLLIDIVSKNGNLLLNVGPKADGTIPENQLKRLADLGEWLAINGEGIYGTHPWKSASAILEDSTELRFTQKNNDLYVFLLGEPKNKIITIPLCKIGHYSKVVLFGNKAVTLKVKPVNDGVEISLPENIDFKFAGMIKLINVL